MNELIYDFRYPFNSLFEFFSGLYFFKLEALHLTIGYLFFSYFIAIILFKTKFNLSLKLATIYFAATIFNNYAYSFFSITIAESFGILAVVSFFKNIRYSLNPISNYMLFFTFIALVHLLLLSIFNEQVMSFLEFKRFAVVLKVFVLALNIMILFRYLKDENTLKEFILKNIFLFNVVAICYLIQIAVFISGTLPYGSFSPAGWSESIIPSFGSTSIERGHLGKFFVPLFPLYLFAYMKYSTKKSLILFLFIAFLNFSASSYMFLLMYLLLTFLLFRKELKQAIFLAILFIGLIVFYFHEQIFTLFLKVYELAIVQDESGGRSFSLLLPILENYNFLGYGYGGSSYRNLHGIEGLDLNNSIVVFFGQLSFVGIVVILSFIYMIFKMKSSIFGLKLYIQSRKKIIIHFTVYFITNICS
ncbi:MAG: hypothetical protein PWQ25_1621 [Deferribacteres bacterium]|jgi:hypothetical protein|nr:hypothetical protein [Deferribacteres bacterium]